MIPFEELDKALARWKARSQGGVSVDAAREFEAAGRDPGATPAPELLSSEPDRTGEIDLEAVVETYDEN
ncbi:MAG: hypothetical protein JWM82_2290 [Myxococcales bacterium]|jgi:hypothetical protein|nr:hypothetical protein [Myxococcales bacterium]